MTALDKFLSQEPDVKRLIIGRNECGGAVAKEIKIDAIIDDFFTEKTWQNIPVIKSPEIPKNSLILNCSMSIAPLSCHMKFDGFNGSSIIGYFELMEKFKLPDFVEKSRQDLAENQEKWQKILENLADEISKKTLRDILNYRQSANYNFLKDYSIRLHEQYFEDFMEYKGEVFVDAGGFIGDTSEEFIKKCPDCKHIYFFEPSPVNMLEAKKRLKNLSKIDFIEYGLSDQPGKLRFNSDSGSSSAISISGNNEINVTTLDEYVKEKVTFIKMDLEGWEMKALQGAKNHIAQDHPKLAIAVYHDSADFWKVYDFITAIRSDYDVFLRHYTEGWSETIMYFKPKKITHE